MQKATEGKAVTAPQPASAAQRQSARRRDAVRFDSPHSNLAQLARMIHQSPRAQAQHSLMADIHNSPRMVAQRRQLESLFDRPMQRKGIDEEEPMQALADKEESEELDAVQRQAAEKEDLLQRKSQSDAAPLQLTEETTPRTNHTGLPDHLKSGIENLSGIAMDDVKVHYNSSKPAQLQALAYAQGADIHVAPGQARHVPHEAWHVVQQKQGRVKPTLQAKGVAVNDDSGLEREADVMGTKALQLPLRPADDGATRHDVGGQGSLSPRAGTLQAKFYRDGAWMQEVTLEQLTEKFEATTRALWASLQGDRWIVCVNAEGSGGSYSFATQTIQISKNWLQMIEEYVKSGKKDTGLLRAISALTHEMSHAHDHQVRKESPEGASTQQDDWVLEVLKTELRAWMKEARSARENSKGKQITPTDDDNFLIFSWVAVKYLIDDNKFSVDDKDINNDVIQRLNNYYNKNKSPAGKSSSLKTLINGSLLELLRDYSRQIRDQFTSDDAKLRPLVNCYMTKK